MSERTDSLAAELKRKRKFEEYFSWWAASRPSPSSRVKWLAKAGIETTVSSVWRLHRGPEAFAWRHGEGVRAMEATDRLLPRDIAKDIRNSILLQRYLQVSRELTHQELKDLEKGDLERDKLRFAKQKERIRTVLQRQTLRLAVQKLRSKLDAAMDALAEEIKGNERAQKHFDAMREALREARA